MEITRIKEKNSLHTFKDSTSILIRKIVHLLRKKIDFRANSAFFYAKSTYIAQI